MLSIRSKTWRRFQIKKIGLKDNLKIAAKTSDSFLCRKSSLSQGRNELKFTIKHLRKIEGSNFNQVIIWYTLGIIPLNY